MFSSYNVAVLAYVVASAPWSRVAYELALAVMERDVAGVVCARRHARRPASGRLQSQGCQLGSRTTACGVTDGSIAADTNCLATTAPTVRHGAVPRTGPAWERPGD